MHLRSADPCSLSRPFPGRVPDAIIPPVDGNDAIVVATGEIDVHTASALHDAIDRAPAGTRVVVDVSAVTFMDSSGLGVLVAAQQRRAGALVVRGPCASVAKVLAYTGLDHVLVVERPQHHVAARV